MFQRIASKRAVRILWWIFITLVTLTILAFVWTNWSGRRRWAATKATLEREGETLDFQKLLFATPPDAENLLAIEPLRGIADVMGGDEGKGEPGAKRKALEALKWTVSSPSPPTAEGVSFGKATEFQDWVTYLNESKFLDLPQGSATSARDVLTALDGKFPVLRQLADEADKRTKAMFLPGMREREMPAILISLRVPHYSTAMNLGRILSLRAKTAVAAKDSVEATRSIVVVRRLAQACKQEPLLIGFLVGNSLEQMALEQIWSGLNERVFAEDDLRRLQTELAADTAANELLTALRGELSASLNAVEYLQAAAAGEKPTDADVDSALSSSGVGTSAWRALPGGLFDHWKSVIAGMELRHLIQPLKKGGLMSFVHAREPMETEIKQHSNIVLHPDYFFANLTIPTVSSISANALLVETRRRQALTAVALERFALKRGRYPSALDELAPDFVAAVPVDLCDGKSLRYRTTKAARYALWSVAFDGQDAGGEVKRGIPIKSHDYRGDWAWQYEPFK